MLIKSTATFLSLYPSIHPSMATFMHVFDFTIDLLAICIWHTTYPNSFLDSWCAVPLARQRAGAALCALLLTHDGFYFSLICILWGALIVLPGTPWLFVGGQPLIRWFRAHITSKVSWVLFNFQMPRPIALCYKVVLSSCQPIWTFLYMRENQLATKISNLYF
jgi:hypothetical protein